MNGEGRIQLADYLADCTAHLVLLRVVLHDGVVMDDEVDVHLFQHVALYIVDYVVAGHRVLVGAQLHVRRGVAASGAVVVDEQVVDAEDLFMGEHQLRDFVHQFIVGLLAEQRRDCVLRDAHAGIQNENRDGEADAAVDVEAEKVIHEAAQQDGAGGDYVVPAVDRGRVERGRIYFLPERLVESRHPELHRDGGGEQSYRRRRDVDRLRVYNLGYGRLHKLRADEQNQRRHGEAGEVFVARVAVRVLLRPR